MTTERTLRLPSSPILFIVITFLVFFRARWALGPGGFDEACYLEYTHKLVGLDYPACYSHSHFPGIAIFWAPFAGLGRLMGWLTANSPSDWIVPLTGFSSFLYWAVSLYCLVQIQQTYFSNLVFRGRSQWPILFLLSVPVLSFAVRDTHMVHSEEWSLSVLALFLILSKRWLLSCLAILFLTSVRLNDSPMFLMLLGAVWDDRLELKARNPKTYVGFVSGVALVGTLLLGLILWIGFIKGYHGIFVSDIFLKINFEAIQMVLFSKNLGMLWYTPAYLVTLGLIATHWRSLRGVELGAAGWMVSVLLFHLGHAVWWGGEPLQIRYLIGSYAAVFFLQLRLWPILRLVEKKLLVITTSLGALTLTLYNFVGADSNMAKQLLDGTLWSVNPYYAHDGTSLPTSLRKLVIEPIGSSPIGFSLFSILSKSGGFTSFESYKKYALGGPSLVVLVVTTVLSLLILASLVRKKFRHRSCSLT